MADLGGSTYTLNIRAVLDTSQMRQELNRLNGTFHGGAAQGGVAAGGGSALTNIGGIATYAAAQQLSKSLQGLGKSVPEVEKQIKKIDFSMKKQIRVNKTNVPPREWNLPNMGTKRRIRITPGLIAGSRTGSVVDEMEAAKAYYNKQAMNFILPNRERTMPKQIKIPKGGAVLSERNVPKRTAGGAASGRGMGRLYGRGLAIGGLIAADMFESSEYSKKGPLNAKSYFGNIASTAAMGAVTGGMVGGPWGAAIGAIAGGGYSIFNQNKQYEQQKKETAEQARELVEIWDSESTDHMRKVMSKVQGGKFLINQMDAIKSLLESGVTPSEELVEDAQKGMKNVFGKMRKVSPGEWRLHEMLQQGYRTLGFQSLSNLGSLGIFTGKNEKSASELVGKTAQMVDYLQKIEHNTEQWSVTYA